MHCWLLIHFVTVLLLLYFSYSVQLYQKVSLLHHKQCLPQMIQKIRSKCEGIYECLYVLVPLVISLELQMAVLAVDTWAEKMT